MRLWRERTTEYLYWHHLALAEISWAFQSTSYWSICLLCCWKAPWIGFQALWLREYQQMLRKISTTKQGTLLAGRSQGNQISSRTYILKTQSSLSKHSADPALDIHPARRQWFWRTTVWPKVPGPVSSSYWYLVLGLCSHNSRRQKAQGRDWSVETGQLCSLKSPQEGFYPLCSYCIYDMRLWNAALLSFLWSYRYLGSFCLHAISKGFIFT